MGMKKAMTLVMSIGIILCLSLFSCQKQETTQKKEAPPAAGGYEEETAPGY